MLLVGILSLLALDAVRYEAQMVGYRVGRMGL